MRQVGVVPAHVVKGRCFRAGNVAELEFPLAIEVDALTARVDWLLS